MNKRSMIYTALSGMLACAVMVCAVSAKDKSKGTVFYEIENVLGDHLPTSIELLPTDVGKPIEAGSVKGRGTVEVPPGSYEVRIRVYYRSVPFLVDIQKIEVAAGDIVPVTYDLKEGIGSITLDKFDKDWDGVLDRVELDAGTDPKDPASYPGAIPFPANDVVMNEHAGWYKGELNCQSRYSGGNLSVGALIHESERRNLDFLAITDARTMKHCLDPEYHSDKVLLIPAYQWGEDGHAAILGPKTYIERWETDVQAAFTIRQVDMQGGYFIVQNPCGPVSPWEWSVPWLHAIEVWQSTWRRWPTSTSDIFGRGKYTTGRNFVVPEMASALVTGIGTVNAQALKYAEQYLKEGHRITSVGGSGVRKSSDGDIGEPATFVYARNLSVAGIIEGLKAGRSFVAASPKGPRVLLLADSNGNDKYDASMGSLVPINTDLRFRVIAEGTGASKSRKIKIRVVKNGHPFKLLSPTKDPCQMDFEDRPVERAWYRADIIEMVDDRKAKAGYGAFRMLATTSPIYAEGKESITDTKRIILERVKTERSGEFVHVATPPPAAANGNRSSVPPVQGGQRKSP